MKIQVTNLGALEQAEFTLGDMTIICGSNNTGKTYATYALFGFLESWRECLNVIVPDDPIRKLLAEGSVVVPLKSYVEEVAGLLAKCCVAYAAKLPEIFAAPKERFVNSTFSVTLDESHSASNMEYGMTTKSAQADLMVLKKAANAEELVVTLLGEKDKVSIPHDIIAKIIGDAIKDILFRHIFPRAYIASAERTGAAIFRKELNFARNRFLEVLSQGDKKMHPLELLNEVHEDYPLPVKRNVAFTRELETLVKQDSFIFQKHKEILDAFADIIGGEYRVTRNDELYFVPKSTRIKLSMDESSSSVRSLLDIGFYLRHVAREGDLLLIDEPELNLHPENQRRVARLFASLVNVGIKVFITTHSDYIVKELNTLIMLKQPDDRFRTLAEREMYRPIELLGSEKVRVYMAQEGLVMAEGAKRKSRCQTLVAAKITQEKGIWAKSFDDTISEMNRIQDEIIWGE